MTAILNPTLDVNFIRVLIFVHGLSKVGTKTKAAKEGLDNSKLFSGFGQEEITKEMFSKAEKGSFKMCHET